MADHPNPVEMFNEMVRIGYVTPRSSQYSDLTMPTAYYSVRSITTSGTGPAANTGATADAELGRSPEGNNKY